MMATTFTPAPGHGHEHELHGEGKDKNENKIMDKNENKIMDKNPDQLASAAVDAYSRNSLRSRDDIWDTHIQSLLGDTGRASL